MAWGWSHTNEAYSTVEQRLQHLPKSELRIIFAEWAAHTSDGCLDSFDKKEYNKALKKARTLPHDVLADQIWAWASEQALCDNGGHALWVCPYGCGPHSLSCDPESAAEVRRWQRRQAAKIETS